MNCATEDRVRITDALSFGSTLSTTPPMSMRLACRVSMNRRLQIDSKVRPCAWFQKRKQQTPPQGHRGPFADQALGTILLPHPERRAQLDLRLHEHRRSVPRCAGTKTAAQRILGTEHSDPGQSEHLHFSCRDVDDRTTASQHELDPLVVWRARRKCLRWVYCLTECFQFSGCAPQRCQDAVVGKRRR